MSRWFRHYAGMMRDEKLVRVAVGTGFPIERVSWIWGAILESAAEINDGGRYDFDAGEAAYFLRCDVADVRSILDGLEASGRIAVGMVVRWGDRQFDSDSSKERQRRYREKRNAQPDNGSTDRHDAHGSTSRDGGVTAQENRDRDRKKDSSALAPVDDRFEEFWKAYPRREGANPKRPARTSFGRALSRGADASVIIFAARALAAKHPVPTPYVPQAATWLNQERWADTDSTGPPENIVPFRTVDDLYAEMAVANGGT